MTAPRIPAWLDTLIGILILFAAFVFIGYVVMGGGQ